MSSFAEPFAEPAGTTAVRGAVAAALEERIRARQASVAVVGLGYVGLPLAAEIAGAGFRVSGVDTDAERLRLLDQGESYIGDLRSELLVRLTGDGSLRARRSLGEIEPLDVVSICVPTPLRKTKEPDLSYVVAAARELSYLVKPGMLVILESTTYPGTTSEVIVPMLEESGLRVGRDFFVCFSPERVDPGNRQFPTRKIPKVIGGETAECTKLGALFYSQFMEHVVPVSSARVAEMAKLLENTFRMINIGLANEMALLCHKMGIDVWEVIEAAATKPFGFMPFYPGPGLGGHCIPVDPHYLSWKVRQAGHEARFIDLAGQINGSMPRFVVERVQEALNDQRQALNGSRIHIIGVAYKPNVADLRESPALDVVAELKRRGAAVSYSDPLLPRFQAGNEILHAQSLDAAAGADCTVILTDHDGIDYPYLVANCRLIVDTRNRLKGVLKPHIVRL